MLLRSLWQFDYVFGLGPFLFSLAVFGVETGNGVESH